jgi:hypothetical protein
MKKIMLSIVLACLILGIGACHNHSTDGPANTRIIKKKKGRYYCIMHPEFTTEKPGICAKCGMELVERDTTGD